MGMEEEEPLRRGRERVGAKYVAVTAQTEGAAGVRSSSWRRDQRYIASWSL